MPSVPRETRVPAEATDGRCSLRLSRCQRARHQPHLRDMSPQTPCQCHYIIRPKGPFWMHLDATHRPAPDRHDLRQLRVEATHRPRAPARATAKARGRLHPHDEAARPKKGAGRIRLSNLRAHLRSEVKRSLFSVEMTSSGISFGQDAEHAPMLVQPPKPSASCWETIALTRVQRSGWPCGSSPR